MLQSHAPQEDAFAERGSSTGQRDGKRIVLLSAVGLLLVAGGVLAVWFAVVGSPAPPKPSHTEATGFEAPRPLPLATLNRGASDALIEDAARALSNERDWFQWLAAGDLARRIAATIGSVAEGDSPRQPLSVLAPNGSFDVVEAPAGAHISAASFGRYDRVARTIGSIDPQAAAAVWSLSAPAIRGAWAEIGAPGSRVEDALSRAIARLVSVKVPAQPVLVQPRGAIWEFADPELESLTSAEKHLLRMGPANQRLIQARLKAFGDALDLPLM